MAQRVIVVGAGVVGLSCAVALAESGVTVDVLARDLPGENPASRVRVPWLPSPARFGEDGARWAGRTRDHLMALADRPRTGVNSMPGRLFAAGSEQAQRVDAPVVWPPDYLRHLALRLIESGGTLTRMSLPVLPPRGLVVNCTGLAARALVPDAQVEPRTLRLLRLADPGVSGWVAGDDLYVVPGPGPAMVTVAGTQPPAPDPAPAPDPGPGPGPGDDGRDTDLDGADPDGADPDGAGLLGRAARLEPRLAGSRVFERRLAVVAHRPTVQLVVRHESGRTVLHCYGHGTAGMSLSWGCAEDVAARIAGLVDAEEGPDGDRAEREPSARGLW